MASLISVKNLRKTFGSLVAIEDSSFEINDGEVFGLLGPNGAGKTTTLECIESIQKFDSGEVLINKIDVAKYPEKVKRIIGVQLQASTFFDRLTLEELLTMFGSFYGSKFLPLALLEEVGLKEKARSMIDQLSGGQKQRFSLAAALVNNPVVLFLDEPTTGLDPQAKRNVWDLVKRLNETKKITIVLTTHNMEEAEFLCHRLAIMDLGKIVALDTPKNLIKALIATGFKKAVEVDSANLEDVFISLTGKQLAE